MLCRICNENLVKIHTHFINNNFECQYCIANINGIPKSFKKPSGYSIIIDNHNNYRIERYYVNNYLIIYDWGQDYINTVIWKAFWNPQVCDICYDQIISFPSKIFDFSCPVKVKDKLKFILAFG